MSECNHNWVDGPFWIVACGHCDEPMFYPLSAKVKVEHCTKCGLLRIKDKDLWGCEDSYLQSIPCEIDFDELPVSADCDGTALLVDEGMIS